VTVRVTPNDRATLRQVRAGDARRPMRMPAPQADYKFYGLTPAGAFAANCSSSLRRNHKLERSSAEATWHVLVYVYKSAPS
jgi:hypothetical protein